MKTQIKRIAGITVMLFAMAVVTNQGLAQHSGKNIKTVSIEKTVKDFSNICLSVNCEVYIFEGTAKKVIIESDETVITSLAANVSENCLDIFSYNKLKKNAIVKVFITVDELFRITSSSKNTIKFFYKPEFLDIVSETDNADVKLLLCNNSINLNISGEGKTEVNGKFDEISFKLSGGAKLQSDIDANIINCVVSEYSDAYLSGLCNMFHIKAGDEATVNSYTLNTKSGSINAAESCEVYISVSDQLNINGSNDAYIEYRGEPTTNINTSGDVKIKNKKEKVFVTTKQ